MNRGGGLPSSDTKVPQFAISDGGLEPALLKNQLVAGRCRISDPDHQPYFTKGACGGTLFGSYGRLSMVWTGLPAGSMIRGVTKMSRFFFSVLLASLRNNRPTNGRSPNIGTLSFVFLTSSASKPPSTTV